MKPLEETVDGCPPGLAVHRDAKQVLLESEIHDFFVEHLRGTNLLVKMFRLEDYRQKILETSQHRTLCGRRFRLTTEYECSISTLELIKDH